MSGTRPRVVILGAGFGGLAAARALDGAGAEVTLVDAHIYSTFQPLLYQVATGGLNPGDVAYPVRSFTAKRAVAFRRGLVRAIDTAAHEVAIGEEALAYDYLVVATGAGVNYFGVPGAPEHTVSLYRRAEAITVRDRLFASLEELAAHRREAAAILVIGGGATGVEMAGTLAELRGAGLAAIYPELAPAAVRVVLVEQGDELLGAFAPRLRRYALRELERRGVEVRLGTSVARVEPDRIVTGTGEELSSDLTIWAAGIGVPDWGLARGPGGRVAVGADLRVEGLEDVFAVGDVAVCTDAPVAQLAQPAIQMGRHAGEQVRRLLAGEPTQPFTYGDRGTMATIGRRSAVVQLPRRVQLRGTLAWLAWLGLHIVTLLGNRNRASALLNLSWRYVSWPSGSGVIVGDLPDSP